jgi:pilus assembly protein FimV
VASVTITLQNETWFVSSDRSKWSLVVCRKTDPQWICKPGTQGMRTRRNQRKNKLPAHGAAHTQSASGHERLVASTLAGMALFAASPASYTLSLGEVTVHSSLGQHLDASVPVQLAAGESLAGGCIQSTGGSKELGRVPDASVITPEATRAGMYTLRISSTAPLYEPIYALGLQASCPGTAAIGRQYVLMLDLPGMSSGQTSLPSQPPLTRPERLPDVLPSSLRSGDALRTTVPRQQPLRTQRSLDAVDTPILSGTNYQVVAGDTVSSIAARVGGRKVKLWTLAGQIFAANPAAFIRNDINLIKLGSTITIPAADTAAEAIPTAAGLAASIPEPVPVPAPLPEPVLAATVTTDPVESEVNAATTEVATTPAAEVAPVSKISPAAEVATRPSGPAIAAADVPTETEASPMAAAAAGIVFGLLVSALLWFRNRLPAIARKRPAKQPAKPKKAAGEFPLPVAVVPAPIAIRTERAEPSITVQWSARPDDALAAEFATAAPTATQPKPQAPASAASPAHSDEITSELEKLFGDDSETMNTPAPAMSAMPGDGDADDTDERKAETLLQALSLLERDYEADLTASQVLDLSTMREALATGTDSMPFIKKPD